MAPPPPSSLMVVKTFFLEKNSPVMAAPALHRALPLRPLKKELFLWLRLPWWTSELYCGVRHLVLVRGTWAFT